MLLRPAVLDESIIGQALPWNVYTATGVLVSPAGMIVPDESHYHRLRARPLYRPADGTVTDNNPARTLLEMIAALDTLYEHPAEHDLQADILLAVSNLLTLTRTDADAGLGLARCLPTNSIATRHCLLCAQLCIGLAEYQGMGDSQVETLAAAALSMNIAAIKLHNSLIDRRQLSEEEKNIINAHPGEAVNILYQGGIRDKLWLDIVLQHHENMDGSGYPTGLRGNEIALHARILRVADLYCAKISGRHYRPPRSSMFAMQFMFGNERRRIDAQMATLLLRRYGFFPPGTLIRLANHETAVVTRTHGQRQPLKHVVSFLDHRGRAMERPVERDTQKSGFAISRLTEIQPDWPDIQWEAIWGYA